MIPDPDFALSRHETRLQRQRCRRILRGTAIAAAALATLYWLAWVIAT